MKIKLSAICICFFVMNSCFGMYTDAQENSTKVVATGVIPYCKIKGEVRFLFARNAWSREQLWGDFCGDVKDGESVERTAANLISEGTMHLLENPDIRIAKTLDPNDEDCYKNGLNVQDWFQMCSHGVCRVFLPVYFDFPNPNGVFRLYFVWSPFFCKVAKLYSTLNTSSRRSGYAYVEKQELLRNIDKAYLFNSDKIYLIAKFICVYSDWSSVHGKNIILNPLLSAELKNPYVYRFLYYL